MGLTYSQAKEVINAVDRSGLEDLIERFGEEVVEAALACDVQPADIDEAYEGKWDCDEDFVRHLVSDTCEELKDLPSYIHIDWTSTARDVLMDYSEDNGHYFRSL